MSEPVENQTKRVVERFLALSGELSAVVRSSVSEETKKAVIFGSGQRGSYFHGMSGEISMTGLSPGIDPGATPGSYNQIIQKRAEELRMLYPEKESADAPVVAEDA